MLFIYDIRTGKLVRRFATGSDGLINDATIAPNGDVYATDSMRGLLFRVPAKAAYEADPGDAAAAPVRALSDTPVGTYSNGLVPAGKRYLLVVGTSSGVLARVDLETKRVRQVEGVSLPVGDGLARTGRTLYAVNAGARVTQVKLSRDWLRGSAVRDITSPSFRFPTTVQIAGRRLLVVNSQFDKRGGHARAAVHGVGGSSPELLVRLSQSPSCWPTSATDEPAAWIAPPMRSA